ncbi:hypothetical protein [Gimesia benthica]|nr:hypothetical protein [Gimesia benthica]
MKSRVTTHQRQPRKAIRRLYLPRFGVKINAVSAQGALYLDTRTG